jgi:RND family efflux transporter MFP subunit
MSNKKKFLVLVGVLIVAGLIFGFSKDADVSFETEIVTLRNVSQEVNVTGRVEPVNDVDLSFEKTGRVSKVNVAIGDIVLSGDVLAELNDVELSSLVSQKNADLKRAQAKLRQLEAIYSREEIKLEEYLAGTRQEELDLQKIKIANAEVSLRDAEAQLIDILNDVYTDVTDAVFNRADQLFTNPNTNPEVVFDTSFQLKIDLKSDRSLIGDILVLWQSDLNALTSNSDLDSYAASSEVRLEMVRDFLDDLSLAVNGLTVDGNNSQATLDIWRAQIFTGRSNVNTAIDNLANQVEAVQSAESTLSVEKGQLVVLESGTAPEVIRAQSVKLEEVLANALAGEADVAKARADVVNARNQLSQMKLVTPIDGIVVKQDAKVGEVATQNTIIAEVVSEGEFEIEVFIPEADIAKLVLGDSARVLFDAYSGEEFRATVFFIDPAETVIEGVSTYRALLHFTEADDRIRAGMTVDLDIVTGERSDVIAVPLRAVVDSVVGVINEEGQREDREVTLGLRGSNGLIEILDGLVVGEEVVTFEN